MRTGESKTSRNTHQTDRAGKSFPSTANQVPGVMVFYSSATWSVRPTKLPLPSWGWDFKHAQQLPAPEVNVNWSLGSRTIPTTKTPKSHLLKQLFRTRLLELFKIQTAQYLTFLLINSRRTGSSYAPNLQHVSSFLQICHAAERFYIYTISCWSAQRKEM